jgi:hypothetical protein
MVAAVVTVNIGLAVACLVLVFWLRQLQLMLHRFNVELSFVQQNLQGLFACAPQYFSVGQLNIQKLRQQIVSLQTVQQQVNRGISLLGLLYTIGTRLNFVTLPRFSIMKQSGMGN